ncbi:AAA family ATPase [Actinokineospora sp. UTMC 2448]|uniref:AAA family ATPase n=1 Tax=Actinokineospora sp. UTMC 2448 TaxID=2268449 RepID=UPI002164C671|nr:AAA family ATPase [Actinokineospora sp. UTMC 2448]UVS78260.1 Trifunctional NAD biosynthesis/regulator protein NadR [Actinokineospora sp. UTMC 2448]
MRFRHALVVGKFYPPHRGHHHLIRSAAAVSERTTVAMLGASVESMSIPDRVSWLSAEHAGDPGVMVLGDLDDHPIDFHDDAVWEAHLGVIRAVLARRAMADGGSPVVDAVFSGEDYGPELAARLGAAHVRVERLSVSGTAVRRDPVGRWGDLASSTRAGLAVRVVVVGAESTGTTTLSRALAEHFGAPWVGEYGREHTERKLAAARELEKAAPPGLDELVWTDGDFVDVALRQSAAEDAAAGQGPLLVCDNDAWAATVWAERYLGRPCALPIPSRTPALYLLTDHVGVPFEQDGWRDGEHLRAWMTARFASALRDRGVPWVLLSGTPRHRLRRAARACAEAMRTHLRWAPPLTPATEEG